MRATVLFPIVKTGDGKRFISNEPVPTVIDTEDKTYMYVYFPYDVAHPSVCGRLVRKAHWTERAPVNRSTQEYADVLARAMEMQAKWFRD